MRILWDKFPHYSYFQQYKHCGSKTRKHCKHVYVTKAFSRFTLHFSMQILVKSSKNKRVSNNIYAIFSHVMCSYSSMVWCTHECHTNLQCCCSDQKSFKCNIYFRFILWYVFLENAIMTLSIWKLTEYLFLAQKKIESLFHVKPNNILPC